MGIIRNKNLWLVLLAVILGTALRLIFINKPDGLWNDEYVSYAIAAIPFGKGFWAAVSAQCHMPFYYLYLKLFMSLFGHADLTLRLTSLFSGVLSIPAMYFVGREFKDDRLGILCASITALSSFLIYFSQEVRFYGLLFLFSSLALLFTLKLAKKQDVSNTVWFVIFNFMIMFTHTIGFIFVLFNLIFISVWLANLDEKYKYITKKVWLFLLFLLAVLSPFVVKILTSNSFSQWWSNFSPSVLGFFVTDYFSPILTNIVSAPANFFYNFTGMFIIFALIPSIIAVAGIFRALKTREFKVIGLFCVVLAYVTVLVCAAVFGKLVFLTKYTIEVYPILIVLMAFGLLEFKKELRYFLIFLFCFLNMFYVLVSTKSAPKLHRPEGHKIVADLLNHADLKKDDYILLNYYPKERFEKYFDFGKYNVISIDKGNFPQYLGNDTQDILKNGKIVYKNIFTSGNNNYFNQKFNKQISKLKPNQKLSVVILTDVAVYSPTKMLALTSDNREYGKAPFLFLVFSSLKNSELQNLLTNLQILRLEQKGSWTVITFQHK